MILDVASNIYNVGVTLMPNCDTLLQEARRNPKNVRFRDVCALAECYGFILIGNAAAIESINVLATRK